MRRFLPLAALAFLTLTVTLQAENWTHWRGPTQNGVSPDTGLPAEWSPKKVGSGNLIWKQPFGARSSPLVLNGKVYIIGDAGDGEHEQERVACFDAKTGEVLWKHSFNVFHTDIVTDRVGWANLAGDPETGNVYAHGVQGLFFCFAADGKVLWSKSLTEEYGRITGYGGRVTSPIVVDDLVIIHFLNASWGDQGRGGHRFLAMDKKTGVVRWWSTPGGQPLDTIYSVPVTAWIGGEHQLICGGADGFVHGMRVATGEKLWSYQLSIRGINVSPVVDEASGRVYIGHSEENVDTNVQGLVVCLDASKVTGGKPTLVWKQVGIRDGYVSPVLHAGRLYVCDNEAKMFCLNAETGEPFWTFKYGRNNAKGSPVWADGKLYIGVNDTFGILKPSETKCEFLSKVTFNRPDEIITAMAGSPAVADGRVYFSTSDETYCIGTKEAKAPMLFDRVAGRLWSGKEPLTAIQVEPADVVLAPGAAATFKIRGVSKD